MTDVAQAKRRFTMMFVLDTVAMLTAGGFAFGYFRQGVEWMLPAFVVALVAGFGVQIWFIAGLGRANKGV